MCTIIKAHQNEKLTTTIDSATQQVTEEINNADLPEQIALDAILIEQSQQLNVDPARQTMQLPGNVEDLKVKDKIPASTSNICNITDIPLAAVQNESEKKSFVTNITDECRTNGIWGSLCLRCGLFILEAQKQSTNILCEIHKCAAV